MRYLRITCLLGIGAAILLNIHSAFAGFSFVPGDYYTSNYFSLTITQYDPTGNVVGSLTLSPTLGNDVRGIAFGPDNLLYATLTRGSNGFAVLALDSAGNVHQTYTGPVYVFGNISFGKIAVDSQYLYVAGQDSLVRFTLSYPSSITYIYTNNQVFDVKPLPSGNLIVASAYQIDEITNSGMFVRTIPMIGGDNRFVDVRGVEYDPARDNLFVTELGESGFFFQLIRLNGTTGNFENSTTFVYGDDMFLTSSGELLVGSRSQNPEFFDENLNPLGMLHGGQQMFVTQYNPAPSCEHTTTISSNFNGTKISKNSYVWFNSVIKPGDLGSSPVTIKFSHQTITSGAFTVSVPDATITFDPSAIAATTTFNGGVWETTAPSSGLAGNTFLSGTGFMVPADIPGGLKNVTWTGTVSTDTDGVGVQWKWAAAVYNQFNADNSTLGVKPVDDNKASQYENSDHAGTPENFKLNVIGGARGGGGANYTGSYSGTASIAPCK